MDDGLAQLIGDLPGWAQAVGGLVIVAAAAILGRGATKARRRGRGGAPARPKTGRPTRSRPIPHASGTHPEGGSAGQFGPDATRDLTAREIAGLRPAYAPKPDGAPDPGEIVWTWVPFAENDGRGKDRPVLLIARIDDRTTAGCYLSTKEHRDFVSVGRGGWDPQGRESYLSPERVLRISDSGVRREGHTIGAARFDDAVAAVKRRHRIR